MPPRGRRARRGGAPVALADEAAPPPVVGMASDDVSTVAVRRLGFGRAGRPVPVLINCWNTTFKNQVVYQYDIVETGKLSLAYNMELVSELQTNIAPQIFTPRGVFDGRRIFFSFNKLDLEVGDEETREFDIPMQGTGGGGPPRIRKIYLTLARQINLESLRRFINGTGSQDEEALHGLTALNVVLRMEPTMTHPFQGRSFYIPDGRRSIGGGIDLWRGFFQSVRPTMGTLVTNVDISTAAMYKEGPLLGLCLEFINESHPNALAPKRGFPDRERIRLQRFITSLRFTRTYAVNDRARPIKTLTREGASDLIFTTRAGQTLTVANYFQQHANITLRYPDVICVETPRDAFIPLELCEVVRGQIMKKEIPSGLTKSVVEFSTKRPAERLASIKKGLEVLGYARSQYVQQFGMSIDESAGLIEVNARQLEAPRLKYGQGSRAIAATPSNGAWNMADKRFYESSTSQIGKWIVVIFERRQQFGDAIAQEMVKSFLDGCRSVGIEVQDPSPLITWGNGQGRIGEQLHHAGNDCVVQKKAGPNFILVVLPEGGNADIYHAVKFFGDVQMGVPTQCVRSQKCKRAKMQYWANVMLKVNCKLGGINVIPDPNGGTASASSVLADPSMPTMIIGADVIHPPPHTTGRPSFASVVGSLDSHSAKYIAATRVQEGKQEMIAELQDMCKELLSKHMSYRKHIEKKVDAEIAPKRIIFYRDGVSEGEFDQVIKQEIPRLRDACAELGVDAKITLIITGKRHHIRMFPKGDGDRSGNCFAGTVVDKGIGHPTEFDFFLLSHGGLLGTSRPTHYSVMMDENRFTADALQALTNTLCYVYGPATRSVSIPTPVYYADTLCRRAKLRFHPGDAAILSDEVSQISDETSRLKLYTEKFHSIHRTTNLRMYFC